MEPEPEIKEAELITYPDTVTVINSDRSCSDCGTFLGMTCDPFGISFCDSCFEHVKDDLFKKR